MSILSEKVAANTLAINSIINDAVDAQNLTAKIGTAVDADEILIENNITKILERQTLSNFMNYVNNNINVVFSNWQNNIISQLNFTTSEPTTPYEGVRYINTATGTGSISNSITFNANSIYEWNIGAWVEFVPRKNYTLWDENLNKIITFDSTNWVDLGYALDNSSNPFTAGIITATGGNSTNWNTAYTHSQLITGNPHQIDFIDLVTTPTTISGYGITDNLAYNDVDNNFSVPQSGQDAVNFTEFVTLQQISPQSTLIISQRNISFGESYIANYRDTVINDGATYYPNSAGYEYAAIKQQNIYPSLLTIPSAEKLSKLYSILPPDRTGDFTVSRASIATRINSDGILVTEANDVIRFDYTNGFPEILVEGQSTNLALRSEEFDNVTAWNHIGSVSVTANNIISPDGNLTADKIISSTTLERHHLVRSFSNTTDLSATASFFVKEGGQKYVACSFLHASNSSGIGIIIDLTDGSLFSSSVSSSTYSYIFTSLINGWKYITFTITNPATHYPNNLNIGGFEDNSFTYNGNTIMPNYISDGIKGIYLYGAQIELGTSATSYIKTLGTTVTRVADVVTVTPPVGVTSIIETINNIDQAPITTIPGTYQIPNGRFNKIIML